MINFAYKMEKIIKAKSLHRTDVDPYSWHKNNAYFSDFTESAFSIEETIPRRNSKSLSIDEFRMSYECANRPLIIENLVNE